jgi:hypothetical protein
VTVLLFALVLLPLLCALLCCSARDALGAREEEARRAKEGAVGT